MRALLPLTLLALIGCASPSHADVPGPKPVPRPATTPPPSLATAEASPYGLVGSDYACAPCVSVIPFIATVKASSTLQDKPAYGAANAFDGDPATAWCEGVEGTGAGQTLRLTLKKPLVIDGAFVLGGYFKSEPVLAANARVKGLAVRFGGMDQEIALPDPAVSKPLPDHYPHGWFEAARSNPTTVGSDWPEAPVTSLEFEVRDAWPGAKYADLCISEIELHVVDPDDP
jgi:hypothetical protein